MALGKLGFRVILDFPFFHDLPRNAHFSSISCDYWVSLEKATCSISKRPYNLRSIPQGLKKGVKIVNRNDVKGINPPIKEPYSKITFRQ